jgi:uncharacterized protein YjbI with pentapeptide repeats
MIETANNSILALQSDLVVQQDLAAEWIVRAIRNDFSNANLSGADLSYADLDYADLGNADLSNANLSNADLSGADLSGADLTGVNWDWATCPDGTAAYYHGQTCVNNL